MFAPNGPVRQPFKFRNPNNNVGPNRAINSQLISNFNDESTANIAITNFNQNFTLNNQGESSTHNGSKINNQRNPEPAKKTMKIFTGTVSKVIKWNKIYKNSFCLFEVIATLVSVQENANHQIFLLKDRRGPILQVIRYPLDHIELENIHPGLILRCVGTMKHDNMLHGISIRKATSEEISTLQRICYICDHAIDNAIRNNL